jgi:hypothetical protein
MASRSRCGVGLVCGAAGLFTVVAVGCAGSGGNGSNASQFGGSSSTISMQAALSYAMGAGLSCNNDLVIAGAIAAAESSLEPGVSSTNPPTSGCPSGSIDRGLWQVNSCYHPSVSATCAFNPACNAMAMASISSDGTNWSPWSTYTSGAYMAYMGEAMTAYSSVCGADAGGSGMEAGKDGGDAGDGGDSGDSGDASEGGNEEGGGDGGGDDASSGDDGGSYDSGGGSDGGGGAEDSASEDSGGFDRKRPAQAKGAAGAASVIQRSSRSSS